MSADTPVIVRDILAERAITHGSKPAVIFADGTEWTYAELLDQARRVACSLAQVGVKSGDRVFTWLPNGADFLRVWLGSALIGAVPVPCNLAWKGQMLAHAIKVAEARIAIVHHDLAARLADVELGAVKQVVIVGDAAGIALAVPVLPGAVLDADGDVPAPPLQAQDTMALLFTSGTTGPSKAAHMPYTQAAAFLAPPWPDAMGEDARFLLVLPMFHAGGLVSAYTILRAGGTLVMPGAFSTDAFWETVQSQGATSTTLVEQMAAFLLARPATDNDADNSLDFVNIAPMGPTAYRFAARFGVQLWTSYGSTEIGAPIATAAAPDRPGVTGRLRTGYAARIVGPDGADLAEGIAGELHIRAKDHGALFAGYAGDAAQRPDWVATGDLFRRDADGWYYFIDRLKDAIRRRGENISSYEVEIEVMRFPGIREVAAYAVPASVSEDDLMICVSSDTLPDWTELVAYLRANMPPYMVPRFYRYVIALPRNQSGKVLKQALRTEGVTADSWDREGAANVRKAG